MKQNLQELWAQCVVKHTKTPMNWQAVADEYAELIIQECTQLLFAESERLYAYSSECDNLRHSDEAELCAEKCMDNIKMIEEHFGVEQ